MKNSLKSYKFLYTNKSLFSQFFLMIIIMLFCIFLAQFVAIHFNKTYSQENNYEHFLSQNQKDKLDQIKNPNHHLYVKAKATHHSTCLNLKHCCDWHMSYIVEALGSHYKYNVLSENKFSFQESIITNHKFSNPFRPPIV